MIRCSTRGFVVSVHKIEYADLATLNVWRYVYRLLFYFMFCPCLQVSFGSLIGFLPYRNLATKWKFIAFESWLRRKGLDPSTYRKSLGIIGNYNATSEEAEKIEGDLPSHMKLEDLFALYDQEKVDYLSTFIGQVCAIMFG